MDPSTQSLDDHAQEKMKTGTTGALPMETVGEYLKKEREKKRLSLHEVAQLTKISELYLGCLEKDDFEKVPKGPYVKGYIASYARMIGADTEQALRLYEAIHGKKTQTDETLPAVPPQSGWKTGIDTALESFRDWWEERKKRRSNRWLPSPGMDARQPHSAPSLLKIDRAPKVADPSMDTTSAIADEAPRNVESSVLIPFKRVAPAAGLEAADGIDDAPPAAEETQTTAYRASALSVYRKLATSLVAAWAGMQSTLLKVAAVARPVLSQKVLVTLACLTVGGAVIAFCGIGVYHVFFYDPPPPQATETTVTDREPENALAALPQPFLPHKTPRFFKPDSPLSAIAVDPAPAASPTAALPTAVMQKTVAKQIQATPLHAPPKDVAGAMDTPAIETTQLADGHVKVLKATVCSTIEDRMPADIATAFPLSVDRVYVWTHVQAEQYPTAIRHMYFHEGRMINQVELSIRSPFWRTWSFKSIDKDSYRGHWRVDITSADGGEVLRRLYFVIN